MQPQSQSTPAFDAEVIAAVTTARLDLAAWLEAHPDARLEGREGADDGDLPREVQDLLLAATNRPEWLKDEIELIEPLSKAIDPVWTEAHEALRARGPAVDDSDLFHVYLGAECAAEIRARMRSLGHKAIHIPEGRAAETVGALILFLLDTELSHRMQAQANEVARVAWEAIDDD